MEIVLAISLVALFFVAIYGTIDMLKQINKLK
jgi:hypothetical protein